MRDITDIKNITSEELLQQYLEFKQAQEDMDAGIKVIQDEFLSRLQAMKITGLSINGYSLQKVLRSSYTGVLLSVAKELGCTDMIEKINSDKLRKLEEKGVEIKGAKRIQYLLVREEKK